MREDSAHVRAATVADLPAIADIHIAARATYWGGVIPAERLAAAADWLRRESYQPDKLDRPGYTTLVAVDGDEVVGFAALGPPHDEAADPASVGELWQIHVRPDRHRRGLGSLLHAACVSAWRSAGVVEAHLEVWERNTVGRAFYERQGWRFDRVLRPAVDDSNFVRLRLVLPGPA